MIYPSKQSLSIRFFLLSLITYFCLFLVSPLHQVLSQEEKIKNKLILDRSNEQTDQFNKQAQTTDSIENLVNWLNRSYFAKKPIGDLMQALTLEKSYDIQQEFVQSLIPQLGKPVGYKVGLTNASAQQRLQINHPVRGILLEKMLLEDGATVQANFGSVPRLEGDLMVRVGSDQINQAKTPEEAIQHIDAVIPFIELPDLMFQKGVKLTGAKLVAVNVGARLGVVGKPIPLRNKKEWQTQLSQIKVTIKDSRGQELGTGSSDSLLNDPLNVVLWLKDELNSRKITLKKGDLISLGSMTNFIEIPNGETITATYQGLEKDQPTTITITFTE